jgi:hypothetical protein
MSCPPQYREPIPTMSDLLNRISFKPSEQDLQEVRAAIKTLQDKLMPHLVSLQPEDRRELSKMGTKTVAFVARALEHAKANPAWCPAFLDVQEMEVDLAAFDLLESLQRPITQLSDALDDSRVLAGSEAYRSGLVIYQAAKAAAKLRQPGAVSVADDLARQFTGRVPGKPVAEAP